MAERYFFFDSTVDDEREYTAKMYADYFDTLVDNGVFADQLNSLQITCSGSNMNSLLGTGRAFIKGHFYENDSALSLRHNQADLVNDRIDLIVLRLDRTIANRNIKAMILEGTPAGSPVDPGVVRNDEVYDIKLAKIIIRAGQSVIQNSDITDIREYARYQTKPAWYPDGNVPLDAWMYTVFKNQLTDQEITDIEANESLMDMINKSSLPKKQDLSEIITNGIIANALNELKVTQTDTPSKAVKVDTGKVNVGATVYTHNTPTGLTIEPYDAIEITNEAHTTDGNGNFVVTYPYIAKSDGSALADVVTDVAVTKASDGSAVTVTNIDAKTGAIETNTNSTDVLITYKTFGTRKDIVAVGNDGKLKVVKGTSVKNKFEPKLPTLAKNEVGIAEIDKQFTKRVTVPLEYVKDIPGAGYTSVLASDKNGTLYLLSYPKPGFYEIHLYKSIDNGKTWIDLNMPASTEVSQGDGVVYVTKDGGKIFVLWRADEVSGETFQHMALCVSTDGGKTWSKKTVHYHNSNVSGYATMSYNYNSNRLHISYVAVDSTGYNTVYMCYTDDDGATISALVELTRFNDESVIESHVHVSKDNVVHVVAQGQTTNNRDKYQILYWKSTDNGASFTEKVVIKEVNNYKQEYPRIISNPNNSQELIVVCAGESSSRTMQHIKISKSTNGGSTWSAWEEVDTTNTSAQLRPNIFWGIDDKILIMYSASASGYQIKQVTSNDKGSTWENPQDIHTVSGINSYVFQTCVNYESANTILACIVTNSADLYIIGDVTYDMYSNNITNGSIKQYINYTGAKGVGNVITEDVLKYTLYKKQLTSEDITRIEGNSQLMDIIKNNNIKDHVHQEPIVKSGYHFESKRINAKSNITFTVPLPRDDFKRARVCVFLNDGFSSSRYSVLYLGTENKDGYGYAHNGSSLAMVRWQKYSRYTTTTSENTYDHNVNGFSGNSYVYLMEAYIKDNSLYFKYYNTHSSSSNMLNIGYQWEVYTI